MNPEKTENAEKIDKNDDDDDIEVIPHVEPLDSKNRIQNH